MNHLTVNQIIDFVSLNELNGEVLEFCAEVNGHIRKCEECRKLVDAFQTVHDEFVRIGSSKNFEEYVNLRYVNDGTGIRVSQELEK